MFKIKVRDDLAGCGNDEFTSILDISHKKFLCKTVDNDPYENIEICNIENEINDDKKLISSNIDSVNTYYNATTQKYYDFQQKTNNRGNVRDTNNKFFGRLYERKKIYIRKRFMQSGR